MAHTRRPLASLRFVVSERLHPDKTRRDVCATRPTHCATRRVAQTCRFWHVCASWLRGAYIPTKPVGTYAPPAFQSKPYLWAFICAFLHICVKMLHFGPGLPLQ